MDDQILKLRDVIRFTKMSRSLVYKCMKEGSFPKNFRLGGSRCVGWLQSDVRRWVVNQAEQNNRKALANYDGKRNPVAVL